jgi:acid stress-induced BolA-like protein IbaG/YrbA
MTFNFPSIPQSKIFNDLLTSEQKALDSYIKNLKFTSDEENIIQECIEFYKEAFKYLKSLPLSQFTEDDAKKVRDYLDNVFNFKLIVDNDGNFEVVFRVTVVSEKFREKGKVRNPKYLYNPPLLINQARGIYNRCNSPNSTVFYAAFYENVALRETKPQKGDIIIMTVWKNTNGSNFLTYPISHALITSNPGNDKATKAFEMTMKNHHRLFSDHFKTILEFISSEFVKDKEVLSEGKYEYFFSAYFSEHILKENNPKDPEPDFDFIVYPSVAYKHLEDNICVPERTLHRLKPIHLKEFEVLETYYDHPLSLEDIPADLKLIREATWITDDLIIWEDE